MYQVTKRRKNRTERDWIRLKFIIDERKEQGIESEVREWGKIVEIKKIRRYADRARLPYIELQKFKQSLIQSSREPPIGFSIITPGSGDGDRLFSRLPFHGTQELLEQLSWKTSPIYPLEDLGIFHFETAAYDTEVTEKLRDDESGENHIQSLSIRLKSGLEKFIPPNDGLCTEEYTTCTSLSIYTSPAYQHVLFAISNNFVGLGQFDKNEIIDFLMHDSVRMDIYEALSNSQSYSAKAIARSLFSLAIQTNKGSIVKALLQNGTAGIDPDQEIMFGANGDKFTPIEYAVISRNSDLVDLLLDCHVDANKSYDRLFGYGLGGALELAMTPARVLKRFSLLFEEMEIDLLDIKATKRIIEYGGDVIRSEIIQHLIECGDEDRVLLLITQLLHKHHTKWNKEGVFHKCVKHLQHDTSMAIIQMMIHFGADLNLLPILRKFNSISGKRKYTRPEGKLSRRTLIDQAAQRGHLDLIGLILRNSGKPTSNTLACAVRSGASEAVLFLVRMGCSVANVGTLAMTPLAAAICSKDEIMVSLLANLGAQEHLNREDHLASALEAASWAGDAAFVALLLERNINICQKTMFRSLTKSIQNSHYDISEKLLDSGVEFTVERTNQQWHLLLQPILDCNKHIVTRLLDAGLNPTGSRCECRIINPSINFRGHLYDPLPAGGVGILQLAIQWGDQSIIDRFISEGASLSFRDHEDCIDSRVLAVEKGDKELLSKLLKAERRPNLYLPLVAAVNQKNIDMINTLFDHGGDLHYHYSMDGLERAILQAGDDSILELIMRRAFRTDSQITKGFGSLLIQQAISLGDQDRLKWLLKTGISPPPPTHSFHPYGHDQISALLVAVYTAHTHRNRIVEVLIQQGCNPNDIVRAIKVADHRGHFKEENSQPYLSDHYTTGLVAAVSTGDQSLVELMIRYGASVKQEAVGRMKRTPLQKAAELGLEKMAQLLIHRGANVNAPAAYSGGATALQYAAIGGHMKLLELLLKHGAKVDLPGSKLKGRTAVEWASTYGRLDTVGVLLNARATQKLNRNDHQLERGAKFARENGHFHIADMLDEIRGV